MKNLYTAGLLALCVFKCLLSSAQGPVSVKQQIPDKPLLFFQLSERTECNSADLEKIISAKISDNISFPLGNTFFAGEVVAKVQVNSEVLNINIRSSNFNGALFTLSVKALRGNSQKLMGRIIHPQHGDLLVLIEENNKLYFHKQQQKFFMTE